MASDFWNLCILQICNFIHIFYIFQTVYIILHFFKCLFANVQQSFMPDAGNIKQSNILRKPHSFHILQFHYQT